MRRIYIFALMLGCIASWVIVLNLVAATGLAGEKDLEVPYKNASAETKKSSSSIKGCNTIPHADVKRDCEDAAKLRDRWCKSPNEPKNCDDLKNPLTQAIARKDKAKITEIRKTMLARQTHGQSCADARVDVQHAFKQADGRVAADRRSFDSKRSSAKNAEMKGFYTDMIGYADLIRDYFNDEEAGHVSQITQMRTLVNNCEEQIKKADAALR